MVNQTTVTHAESLWFGSAEFEVGTSVTDVPTGEDTLEGAVNLGGMNNITVNEKWTEVKVRLDNAGEVKRYIKDHMMTISGEMAEANLTNLNILRGGIDILTATSSGDKLTSGGNVEVAAVAARITNTNEDGKKISFTLKKAYNTEGLSINLQPDDGDKPNVIKVTLEGVCDTARTNGLQLFSVFVEDRY